MKARLVLVFALAFVGPARAMAADALCQALPMDPGVPAGFDGSYRIVGWSPEAGAYRGTVQVSAGKSTFKIVRSVGMTRSSGTASLQECGMDKIRSLSLRYSAKPSDVPMSCAIGADGDNYFRISCRGPAGRLEAWFQDR